MDCRCIISLRLTGTMLSLLLLLQLPITFASAGIMQSKVCGADDLTYSNTNGDESFHINGKLADRNLFCKTLLYHYAFGCIFERFLQRDSCGLDLSSVELPSRHGRKMLQTKDKEEDAKVLDSAQKINPKDGRSDHESSLSSIKVAMVGSGFFAAFCGLLFPCCWRKKRATTHTVLSKELSSTDSVSSLQMKSVSEKTPGSPLRVPGSPLRVPGSPLRVPGSPLRVPPSPRFSMSPKLSRLGSVHLSLHEVAKATQNFSPKLQIGEGGFGRVYKAQLENGQVVAVKRGKKEYFDSLKTEFSSEVELLAKTDHRSLVKLLGYVDKGKERLLITEYVPNGNLREHLDGQRGRILDFNQRLEIAIDVAHGLTYLHLYSEKQIIHRDVKASNILLTETMRAKVADFGFARFGVDGDHTHISTNVKGTVGYLDPEYMKTYQLTPKSDVHSFGILLIEILTGRRPVEVKRPPEERVTLRWVFRKYSEGSVFQLVDPLMHEAVEAEILVKIFGLAIQCAAPVRSDRPDMKSVGEQLWGIRSDYLKSVKRG